MAGCRVLSYRLKSLCRLFSVHLSTAATHHCSVCTRAWLHRAAPAWPTLPAIRGRFGSGWWWRRAGSGSRSGRISSVKLAAAAATSCLLTTEQEENSSEYLTITVPELENALEDLKQYIQRDGGGKPNNTPADPELRDGWNLVSKTPQYSIYSRPMKSGITQYKVCARYEDIPAAVFLFVQMDLAGRGGWDPSTDVVELIDPTRPKPSSSLPPPSPLSVDLYNSPSPLGDRFSTLSADAVYWRVALPRPLAKRDYVFARSCILDRDEHVLVLMNKAIDHSGRPPSGECVRVTDYHSQMIIRPRQSFLQDGLDYVLTYHDDTKIKMPAYAYKRLALTNLPIFMESLHKEARALYLEYTNFLTSGSSIEMASERLKALHTLILQIRSSVKETGSSQSQPSPTPSGSNSSGGVPSIDSCESDQPGISEDSQPQPGAPIQYSWQRFIPIRKIQPPRYLPDLEQFLTSLVREGRLCRVPLKCYRAAEGKRPSVSEAASYPQYGDSTLNYNQTNAESPIDDYPPYYEYD